MRIEEVASELGVSIYTINNWYAFKRLEPDNSLSKLLPDYIQNSPTSPRYWKKSDLKKFEKFKDNRVLGRYGKMAKVTQRYVKKEK